MPERLDAFLISGWAYSLVLDVPECLMEFYKKFLFFMLELHTKGLKFPVEGRPQLGIQFFFSNPRFFAWKYALK